MVKNGAVSDMLNGDSFPHSTGIQCGNLTYPAPSTKRPILLEDGSCVKRITHPFTSAPILAGSPDQDGFRPDNATQAPLGEDDKS